MDPREASRSPADSSGDNAAMVKQSVSLPPAFQPRPQGPLSPRFPTNNGSGGARLSGPQTQQQQQQQQQQGQQQPPLRRLDSRSSLQPGQRPVGPGSVPGGPAAARPQGFPQRPPQPQLYPGQNPAYSNPQAGPPKRFPSAPNQGPRGPPPVGPRGFVTGPPGPRSIGPQPSFGPNSFQFNNGARPQNYQPGSQEGFQQGPQQNYQQGPQQNFQKSQQHIFAQRSPSQTSIRSDSTDESRPGTPSSGRPPNFFSQRQLMSGSEGPPAQMNQDSGLREPRSHETAPMDNGNKPLELQESQVGPQGSPGSKISTDFRTTMDDESSKKVDPSIQLGPKGDRDDERSTIIDDVGGLTKKPEVGPVSETDVFLEKEKMFTSLSGRQSSTETSPSKMETSPPPKTPELFSGGVTSGGQSQSTLGSAESRKTENEDRAPSTLPKSPAVEIAPKSKPEPEVRMADNGNPISASPEVPKKIQGSAPSTPKSPSSSAPSPHPPKSPQPILTGSPDPVSRSPVPESPINPRTPNADKSATPSTPQSPNPPKSPGCLRSLDTEKSGRSTPDTEGSKKRATFAKDLIMTGTKDDQSAASTPSDLKDLDSVTPEDHSKGTPTTPSKGIPGTPKKIASPSTDRARHRSRSPKSEVGKSPQKETEAARSRSARESKERGGTGHRRSKKTEGDNDSGVDESTQGHEPRTNGDAGSPTKSHSKIPGPKRSTSSSPTKSPSKSAKSLPKTPDTASSASIDKKKVPMNKIQVGAAPSPNLKTVRSKIGSLENTNHKPGGGNIKIENRKLDFSKAQPKIAAKNDKYTPSGGDKKITQVKLTWNAKPKVGSLENATYKPGGGDKKIETVKLDFKEKAKPKVASKDNVKHVPGGGSVKSLATTSETPQKETVDIETMKVEVKAESKVGSLDNVKHKPGGGDKKIFNDKDYLRQTSSNVESLSGSGSQDSRVVLNVVSPSPIRKTKRLAETDDRVPSSPTSNHPVKNAGSPVKSGETTSRSKGHENGVPVPPTTTPVDEKKSFPSSRKSSLVKTPDRAKTPDVTKRVTIAETEEFNETKHVPKSPVDKRPKTPEVTRRPMTPKMETKVPYDPPRMADKSPSPATTPSPRTKSPPKRLDSEERKSPRKKSNPENPPSAGNRTAPNTPRKERCSPPNTLPLNNANVTIDKLRKSSSKEFRLPTIVSNMLPELGGQDPVIPANDSKIALPKLVDSPNPPSRTGLAQ